MKKPLFLALLPLIIILLSSYAVALENNPENRAIQAERYLKFNSPQDIFAGIAERTKISLPRSEQHTFMLTITEYLDMKALSAAMKTSLVTHFTAEEIAALANFYSMPGSKSAMNKMGIYMSDVLPVVQQEMLKAQQKASIAKQENEIRRVQP